MKTVLSKYFLYSKSISSTELEQDLDVEDLSRNLGLGKPETVAVTAEELMEEPSPVQSLQYPASPATTLWRAAASQWQQASSQWHETERWTPRLRESPRHTRYTGNTPVFSPPTMGTPTKVARCSPTEGMSCGTPDLKFQLKQKFLSRTTVRGSRSAHHLLSADCEQSNHGRHHMVAATRSNLALECYETHREPIPGIQSSMALNESTDVTSRDAVHCLADLPSPKATTKNYDSIHRLNNTRYDHVHEKSSEI